MNFSRCDSQLYSTDLLIRPPWTYGFTNKGWQWCLWHRYVGDYMMVTDLRCWWQNHYVCNFFRYVGDFLNRLLNRSSTSQTCHQHIWSPTSVTNIDVTTLFGFWGFMVFVLVTKIGLKLWKNQFMIIPFTVQATMMIILWFLISPNVGSSHTKQMTVLNKIVAIETIRIRPHLFRILSRRSTVNHVVPLLAVYQVVAVMVIVSNHQEASPVCVTFHGPKIKWAAVSPENKNFIPITATFKKNKLWTKKFSS